jgi:tripartite-type tricarboxylate transporter receptor subunit TctC
MTYFFSFVRARDSIRSGYPRQSIALTAVLVVAAVVSTSLAGCSTSGATSSGTVTSAQDGYAFYKGKSITYIVPQSPGGSYSDVLLPAKPYIEKKLGATLNLEYVPQGTSLVGDDQIAGANPDGLTIGTVGVNALLATYYVKGTLGVNFNLPDLSFIAGTHVNPQAIVACEGSSFTSIQQALQSKQPFKVINTGQGSGFELVNVLFNMYQANWTSLTGYQSSGDQTAGCLRGDAPLADQSIGDTTAADFEHKIVKGLLTTQPVQQGSDYYDYLKDVPTLTQLWQELPPPSQDEKTIESLLEQQYGPNGAAGYVAGPHGIDVGKVAALRDAFKYAFTQPSVIAAEVKAGVAPGWVEADTASQLISAAVGKAAIVRKYIKTAPKS